MIGTLLKAVAYSKAPRTTFTVLHPARAVQFRKLKWDMRHAPAPRLTAVGAAVLALPIGLWLGRRSAAPAARPNGHTNMEHSAPGVAEHHGMSASDAFGPAGIPAGDDCVDRASPRV